MKKYLFTLMMALLTIACSSVIVSCGNDANELPAPDKGTKGIHRIEATFSGDIENWVAVSYYVGHVSGKTYSELDYKTTGEFIYEPIFREGIGVYIPTVVMKHPIDVMVTTKKECESMTLSFSCYYKKLPFDASADKSSTLTVNFKSYVDDKLTKTYSRTFTYEQIASVSFHSVEHSMDHEEIIENKWDSKV